MAPPRIVLTGVRPYDGDYEFDVEEHPFTTLEWRWIKKLSGYLPLTIEDGFRGGDPDLFVAWAVIAMVRAGKIGQGDAARVGEVLASAPFDGQTIQFVTDDEDGEGDDGPPEETPATEQPARSGG